jgi:DNA-binding SARP family transcriptional activator
METCHILRIHLLGNFRLVGDGRPIAGLAQVRLRDLIAYLLLHRDAEISRQQLAFAFWPDTPDGQARNNLRTLLHRLREALRSPKATVGSRWPATKYAGGPTRPSPAM